MNQQQTNPARTVLVISTGFLIIYLLYRVEFVLYATLIIALLGSISGIVSEKIELFWQKLAQLLNLFVPNILLTLVFFCILTPVAFIGKLFSRKDFLKLTKQSTTYYEVVNKEFNEKSFTYPW